MDTFLNSSLIQGKLVFISAEFQRLQPAVCRRGDFRLKGPAKIYEKSEIEYSQMGTVEKERILRDLGLLLGPVRDPEKRISVNLETETTIPIPLSG